jgi:phospholipid-binding lipoprotein MlaA
MRSTFIQFLISLIMAIALTGCATTSKDPLEGINRGVYKFNDVTDKALLKPVATVYKTVTPSPIRKGFNNFFSNLGTITSVFNNLLQLKFANAFSEAGRFVINTTFGLAGFIDVAEMDKIPEHKEDFGQTLGYWGVGNGAYLVLPILGPSTVRDATGTVFDTVTTDPITYTHNIGEIRLHNQLRAAQLLDKRTELLDAKDLVDESSLDPYAFMRDAYLQRRASLVQDGLVPLDLLKSDDDFEAADEDKPAEPIAAPDADKHSSLEPVSIEPNVTEPATVPAVVQSATDEPSSVEANANVVSTQEMPAQQVELASVDTTAVQAEHIQVEPTQTESAVAETAITQ